MCICIMRDNALLIIACLWYFSLLYVCFFFFKQKTAYEVRISDWGSDVCSSDLGDGDEPVGRQEAQARVVPAHESLDAHDLGGHEVALGLDVQAELVATDGGPQLAQEGQPVGGVHVDLVAVDDGVAVRALREVHRHVGALQQKVGGVALLGRDDDPAAGLHREEHPVRSEEHTSELQYLKR